MYAWAFVFPVFALSLEVLRFIREKSDSGHNWRRRGMRSTKTRIVILAIAQLPLARFVPGDHATVLQSFVVVSAVLFFVSVFVSPKRHVHPGRTLWGMFSGKSHNNMTSEEIEEGNYWSIYGRCDNAWIEGGAMFLATIEMIVAHLVVWFVAASTFGSGNDERFTINGVDRTLIILPIAAMCITACVLRLIDPLTNFLALAAGPSPGTPDRSDVPVLIDPNTFLKDPGGIATGTEIDELVEQRARNMRAGQKR